MKIVVDKSYLKAESTCAKCSTKMERKELSAIDRVLGAFK